MKRNILSIALAFICILSCCINAFAVDTSVSFNAGAENYVFSPDGDLFKDFKGLVPGDEKTQNIAIQNTGSTPVTIYMKAEVQDAGKDFLNNITLDIYSSDTKGGKDTLISSGSAASENELINWVKICDKLPEGAIKYITVDLKFSKSSGNAYQNQHAVISWIFQAEQTDTTASSEGTTKQDATDATKHSSAASTKENVTRDISVSGQDIKGLTFIVSRKDESTTKTVKLPYTGSDNKRIFICSAAILCSAAIMVVTVIINKKRDDEVEE